MRRNALTLVIAGLAGLSMPGAALAQARPSSQAMVCDQAQNLVRSRGAVVLGTGQFTYDRYVVHRGFCAATESVRPAWVPTRDNPQCFVGYTCRELEFDDF